MDENKAKSFQKTVLTVTLITMIVNASLGAFKLLAGVFSRSYALISDSVNSFSDATASLIMMIGVKISGKKADKNHPYGHERFECITSLVLAFIMLFSAFEVGKSAIIGEQASAPAPFAVIVAVISIATKAILFAVTLLIAKKTKSSTLKTLSSDHISDVVATTGGLAGIILSINGYEIFDRVAGLIICAFICLTALKIFREVVGKLTDEAADKKTDEQIRQILLSDGGVVGIDSLNTRKFGDRVYADIEIAVRPDLGIVEAHEIAERVHNQIEATLPEVKHCTVHVNPAESLESGE